MPPVLGIVNCIAAGGPTGRVKEFLGIFDDHVLTAAVYRECPDRIDGVFIVHSQDDHFAGWGPVGIIAIEGHVLVQRDRPRFPRDLLREEKCLFFIRPVSELRPVRRPSRTVYPGELTGRPSQPGDDPGAPGPMGVPAGKRTLGAVRRPAEVVATPAAKDLQGLPAD